MYLDFKNFFEKFFEFSFLYKKEAQTQTSVDKPCRFHVEVQGQVVQGHLFAGGQGEVLGRTGRRPRLKWSDYARTGTSNADDDER